MTMTIHSAHRARLVMAAAAVVTSATALAAPAHAAGSTTVTKSGDVLSVTAAAGTTNDINVTRTADLRFAWVEDRAGVTAGAGCQNAGPRLVLCETSGISRLRVTARDGDDRVFVNFSDRIAVQTGSGDDRVTHGGFGGDALLLGGPTADPAKTGSPEPLSTTCSGRAATTSWWVAITSAGGRAMTSSRVSTATTS